MARANGIKSEVSAKEVTPVPDTQDVGEIQDSDESTEDSQDREDSQDIESIFNSLKTLLTTVEKLQKVRQEVGDIKPLIGRMLDGELLAGDELQQLKTGVGSFSRLVRAYSDHQAALSKAQPARTLLDQLLKEG